MKESTMEFFPQRETEPKIYAYELKGVASHDGYIKVGYTTRRVKERVEEQTKTTALDYRIIGEWSAMRCDGSGESFSDHDVHDILVRRGFIRKGEEWFKCSISDVEAAILAVQTGTENEEQRTRNFPMRDEQKRAVAKTMAYFESVVKEDGDRKDPKFLWNAKMRFGKTFATYQLAKAMKMKRVLVLTFKPAVQTAWREDLLTHMDFEGWQFICAPSKIGGKTIDGQYEDSDKNKPIVCFGSFQDFLGEEDGRIKAKNKWVHEINWDLIVFDEYHFGAWRDTAKKLFAQDEDVYELDIDETSAKFKGERAEALDETWLPITANHYLYLSGTPFRALNSGEFMEEQIFNWTYSDEQRAKAEWDDNLGVNPYAALPRMVMLTYKLPDSISNIALGGEFNEFDLNEFFATERKGKLAQFKHKENVQKWLDLIRGAHLETAVDDLRLGAKKPAMPFSDTRLLNVLSHTLWFLPDVASCMAMKCLLEERQNKFYHDYEVLVCAGNSAGMGAKALEPVKAAMGDALKTKTITLSCGKLMTGVTVRPWTGIFMLRNLKSPETYFQAAFRVQSPWEVLGDDGKKEIVKKECYVFDFALDRALRQISDYSCNLDVNETNPEKKVADFIQFLPVLAYDGSSMRRVDAGQILDMAMSGTSATMLARKWESALLVNVDNLTLSRIIDNEEAMSAIAKIEGFRGLNLKGDIETIINKSEKVKQLKRDNPPQTREEKETLSEAEKEYKSKRKLIQEKLIKFATRIPVFMYLTDAREMCLKEVIANVEPDLFKKVTGLEVRDFELLVSLNVFNESRMNEAVYYFKRYEDPSIRYAGIDKHENDERVGLFSTSISKATYEEMSGQQKEDDNIDVDMLNVEPMPTISFVQAIWGGDKSSDALQELMSSREFYESFRSSLEVITDRERQVVDLRYGLTDGCDRSVEEVAQLFSVPCERIAEIEKKVLRKLKSELSPMRQVAPQIGGRDQSRENPQTYAALDAFENEHWAMGMVLADRTDKSDPRLQCFLGYCHENGFGTAKDLDKAKEWYEKAAKQGDESAIKSLERLSSRLRQDNDAIPESQKAQPQKASRRKTKMKKPSVKRAYDKMNMAAADVFVGKHGIKVVEMNGLDDYLYYMEMPAGVDEDELMDAANEFFHKIGVLDEGRDLSLDEEMEHCTVHRNEHSGKYFVLFNHPFVIEAKASGMEVGDTVREFGEAQRERIAEEEVEDDSGESDYEGVTPEQIMECVAGAIKSGKIRSKSGEGYFVLKGEFYDAIKSGRKTTEYRDFTPRNLAKSIGIKTVKLQRGYEKVQMRYEVKSVGLLDADDRECDPYNIPKGFIATTIAIHLGRRIG